MKRTSRTRIELTFEGIMKRPRKMSYKEKRKILILYTYYKMDIEDFHGASDAMNDLRELDAEERGK